MMLRASDFKDKLNIEKQAEWYPVLLDEQTGEKGSSQRMCRSRWNNEGKWNLRNEDLRTEEYTLFYLW